MQIPTQNNTNGKREKNINDMESLLVFRLFDKLQQASLSKPLFYHNFKTEKECPKEYFRLFQI